MNFFFFYTQTMEADTQWALCSINCHNPNCSPSVPNPTTTFETFYKWSRHIIWFAQNKVVSTEVTGIAEIPGDGDRGNPTFVTTRFTTAVKWTLVGGHCATSLINGKVTKLFIKHKCWEKKKKKSYAKADSNRSPFLSTSQGHYHEVRPDHMGDHYKLVLMYLSIGDNEYKGGTTWTQVTQH